MRFEVFFSRLCCPSTWQVLSSGVVCHRFGVANEVSRFSVDSESSDGQASPWFYVS